VNPAVPNAGLAETIIFAILAAAIVVGAVFTITRRNPVTAVMSLVATFFALAGLYATMSAHFIAILQIMVYAGAIMVLFIFVVMILNREEITPISLRGIVTRLLGVVAAGYLAYLGAWVVLRERATEALAGPLRELPPNFGTVAASGMSLFTDFVFPFEAISLLLLVAIVGGVTVSRSHTQEQRAEETHRRLEDIRTKSGPEVRLLPGGEAAPHDDHGHAAHH
jgi:NADH-quinone oxidoreductase subunit J